jgi:basic membrane protein A
MKRLGAFVAAFTAAGVLAACGSTNAGNTTTTGGSTPAGQWTTSHPFKVAWIYVGAKSDAGWTHQHDLGRQAVQNAFGGRVETLYKENVPEGPQVTTTIDQLVNDGANMIFATSFGFQPYVVAAAKKYPNVIFEQATGTDVGKNLAEYGGAGEDGDYLAGMAAGYATHNGKIGFVAPYAIPEVIREIDSYTMGARLVHPGATVKVVWTNSWFNPAAERQAAQSLVASGVDVLGDGVDDPTVGEVAASAGIKWTGYDSNQNQYAPSAYLTNTIYDWGPYYVRDVRTAMEGTWQSHFYYGNMTDGTITIAPFGSSVSEAAKTAILAKAAEFKKGTFNQFTGPVYKQDGSVGIASGETIPIWNASDPSTLSRYTLSWFSEGVIGSAKG